MSDLNLSRAPSLFPRGLSQGVIDAILPARSALLEVLEHVLIDPQRNQFLHARKRGLLRRQFGNFGGGLLERSFGFGARIVERPRPSWWLGHRCNSSREAPS